MKWTQATGLLATFGLIAAGGVWAGCSNGDGGNDAGGNDSGGSDVNQNKDTGGNDSGGNDSGGGDASDGGGINVDASALDCNYYCDSMIAACTGTNNQYLDKATCVSMCGSIPNDAGAGATSGDSLACRMYHLSVAAQSSTNAATHCPHAGPYGYGVCGSLCNDFCSQYFATGSPCKTDVVNGYLTVDACHTYCNGASGADASAGAPGNAATAPSMLCREYHLENAYKTGGTGGGHCDHAGGDGGGVCN